MSTARRTTVQHDASSRLDYVGDENVVEVGPATPNGTGSATHKPLSRRDVYLDGKHIGAIVQVEVHSTATVAGHRYTRTLGHPIRWGLEHATIRGLHRLHIDGMRKAALALADQHLTPL